MTLKSTRIGDAVIEYNDSRLVLSAPISKCKVIQDQYGRPFREVLMGCGADDVILCDVLQQLQVGTDYTTDQIGDWLLGDRAKLAENMKMFERCFCTLLGVDYDKYLATAQKAQKKAKPATTKTVTS